MSRNEKTSAPIARDASQILATKPKQTTEWAVPCRIITNTLWLACRRVAASALTQS